MGDRSEENQLDWSGDFSLADLLDGDVQREAMVDGGGGPQGAASSFGPRNLLPEYTQGPVVEMEQNSTIGTDGDAGLQPPSVNPRNHKEVRQEYYLLAARAAGSLVM